MRRRLTRNGSIAVAIGLATLLALALGISARDASGQSAGDFANWTSASGNVASGTLHGASISLSGTNVSSTPASVVDGSSTVFNRAEFTPPLPTSDAIHFIGSSGSSYTLQFGSPVTNPVLHLGSLASTLQFPAGTQMTRLSGDAEFAVAGSSISGQVQPPGDDANGSVRLTGTFTSIPISTTFAGSDGIYLQVGAPPPAPPPSSPAPPPSSPAPPPSSPAPVVESIAPALQTPPRANQPLVLTARVAGNFKRLLWNLDADPAPEAVGRGPAATSLRFRPKSGRLNVSVKAIGSSGASTSFTQRLGVGPPPTLISRASKVAFSFAQKQPPVYVTGPPAIAIPPDFVPRPRDLKAGLLGCASKPVFGYTGDTTLQAGGLEIRGCLVPVTDVSQIYERERGMLVELAEKLGLLPSQRHVNDVLKQLDGYWSPQGTLNVNGVDLTAGQGAQILTFTQAEAIASSKADLAVGSAGQRIKLENPREFLLDVTQKRAGQIDLGRPFKRLPGSLPKVAGFRFTGDIKVKLLPRRGIEPPEALITAKLELPKTFMIGGLKAEGEVVFRASADRGLILENMRIGPISVNIGALRVKDFQVSYASNEAGEVWKGQGSACVIALSCLDMTPKNAGGVTFANGDLTYAGATIGFPFPGIPLYPGVQLESIDFKLGREPTRLGAGATVTIAKIYQIIGRITLAFPEAQFPFVLDRNEVGGAFPSHFYGRQHRMFTIAASAEGSLKVPVFERIPLGNAYLLYEYPGYVAFGGGVTKDFSGIVSIEGAVDGELNFDNGRFNISGSVKACIWLCGRATGVISSRGVAACLGGTGIGVRYRPYEVVPYLWGCKWSPFEEKNVRDSARSAQAGAPYLVRMDGNDPSRAIRLEGSGGAPRVRVTSPGGQRLDSPAGTGLAESGTLRIVRSEAGKLVGVGLKGGTQRGTYKIEPLPGSPAIGRISEATALPAAKLRAKVRGPASRRTLSYAIARRPGQRVTFMDVTAEGAAREIGSVTGGGRGRLRFKPLPGRGLHRVKAQFELDGMPAEKLTAARFRPPSHRLGRPRAFIVRRDRKGLRLSWRRVRGAARYEVTLAPSIGRQRVIRTRGRRARIKVGRSSRGRVSVRALADMRHGSPAVKRFRRVARPRGSFKPLPKVPRGLRRGKR